MTQSQRWQALEQAVSKAACSWPMNPEDDTDSWGIHQLDPPPHNRLLGPVKPRGGPAGLVMLHGDVIHQWGDVARADMTFSVTKTYLALVAGVLRANGILPEVDQAVSASVDVPGFDSDHNRNITWRQMLQFTSEWQGACFGIPDQVDHYRQVALQQQEATAAGSNKGDPRPLQTPGTHWEYNDIRINQFSRALMHLCGRALPDVLDEAIMQPLGVARNWIWHGYENSWEVVNGTRLQSVPGGGHWGGGMQISAQDQAAVANLLINRGSHHGQQLLDPDWIEAMTTPCEIAPWYGFFTWLNHQQSLSQVASSSSYFAMGIGGQLIWHEPERDLVAVFRWTQPERPDDLLHPLLSGVLECLG